MSNAVTQKFSPYLARLIVDAYEIDRLDEEESMLLEENNPELFEACRALVEFAESEQAP